MGKFLGTYMQTCIIKILGNNFQQQLQHPITKKADAEPKKSRSNKKSRCRTSLLKNGPTKLPCLLIILASWVDFFDIGLLLYPVPHHTLQCCTRKSFWVTRTGESKLFCIGFSLFWSRCRTWCSFAFIFKISDLVWNESYIQYSSAPVSDSKKTFVCNFYGKDGGFNSWWKFQTQEQTCRIDLFHWFWQIFYGLTLNLSLFH